MAINDLIINGGFETGTLIPWDSLGAVVTSQFRHSGTFAAQLAGGAGNAFLVQFLPANPGEKL